MEIEFTICQITVTGYTKADIIKAGHMKENQILPVDFTNVMISMTFNGKHMTM